MQSLSTKGGLRIAKATKKKRRHPSGLAGRKPHHAPEPHRPAPPPAVQELAPAPKEPRRVDANKTIAVAIDPSLRVRVETIWRRHNEMAPVPVSKSAIYRAIVQRGIALFEEDLAIKAPTAA
jgi:hypothetical protein